MINLESVKIGILAKREGGFTSKLKAQLKKLGHSVIIFSEDNLSIDKGLLNNDLYILKSKQLIYLYAAYFIASKNIQVIPDTQISHMFKNRVDSHFSLKRNGFLTPKVFMGTALTIKKQLTSNEYPLIQKPIMSSGSKGITLINSFNDLEINSDKILYLERFIEGIHYLVYFIDDEISICEKKPLANEHEKVKIIKNDDMIKELVVKWKKIYPIMFGHLDLIRESKTDKLYVVDVGTFPEFTNWHGKHDPEEIITNLILKTYYKNLSIKNE